MTKLFNIANVLACLLLSFLQVLVAVGDGWAVVDGLRLGIVTSW